MIEKFENIKGAIFDIDGTVLETMGIWDNAGNVFLEKHGKKGSEDLGKILFSMTISEAADYLNKTYGLEIPQKEIIDGINTVVADFYKNEAQLKPGMKELLENLKAKGVSMTVATSTDREVFMPALERLDVAKYFDNFYTCSEIGKSKNYPDIFIAAMDFMKTRPEETWIFEDGLYSAKTAKKAGIKVVGVYDETSKHDWQALKLLSDEIITFDKVHTALTIAGSDCSGGAGIQADLKTMMAHGVYGMSAITALTAQNTTGVTGIMDVTGEFLAEQIDRIFTDIYPEAVKIGMVSQGELIEVISAKLKEYKAKNIVVDPVMVATSGAKLISDEAIEVLKEKLLPLAELITPNIPEAEVLSGMAIKSVEDMEKAALHIGESFGCAVLCKGGHNVNDANDLLYFNGEKTLFEGKRINNSNTHGTGCTLSSAIASNLAKGMDMKEAVGEAKKYISLALADRLDLGKGSGPMNHAFAVESKWEV